jgi:hypothetical protein
MESFWVRLAWLVPRRLAYWCAIRVGAHATQCQDRWEGEIPAMPFMAALERWK